MNTNTDKSEKTSRRSFTKLIGATIGAVPILSLVGGQGCTTKKQEEQIKQTSPITIGGGSSVSINFDETYYKRIQANKFQNDKGDVIHKFRILNRYSTPIKQKNTSNPHCRLVIHCLNPRGMDSPITIYGSPMGIEFDETEYELELPAGAMEKIRFEANRKVMGKIQYFEGSATTPTEEYDVPTEGICTIDVLDKL